MTINHPVYIGIDYSMTSPAVCVGDGLSIDNSIIYYYTNNKRLIFENDKIRGKLQESFDNEQKRFYNITRWVLNILDLYSNVYNISIEGYSFASKGQVFNIGENTGLVKHYLWMAGYSFDVVAPTTIKKFFTGKGNAKKDLMYRNFVDKTGYDLAELDSKIFSIDKSPCSDIIDSFAITNYARSTKEID